MSIKVSRIDRTTGEKTGDSGCPPPAPEPGAVEKLLASAYLEASAAGELARSDDDGRGCTAGIVVTRRTDDAGNPIGYLLMSRDTV